MLKRTLWLIVVVLASTIIYFLVWPVPIESVEWVARPNPGYAVPLAENTHLQGIERLPIGNNHGPGDVAIA